LNNENDSKNNNNNENEDALNSVSAPTTEQYSSGNEVIQNIRKSQKFDKEEKVNYAKFDDVEKEEKVNYAKFDDVEKALN